MREAITFWCLIATALVLDARDYARAKWRGTHDKPSRVDPEETAVNRDAAPRLYAEACDCERGCWQCDEVEREA